MPALPNDYAGSYVNVSFDFDFVDALLINHDAASAGWLYLGGESAQFAEPFKYFLLLLWCCFSPARRASSGLDQNRYRPWAIEKLRVAVADFAPRADQAKNHSALFTQVVRDDLQFSGILELVSPSFYPPQAPS